MLNSKLYLMSDPNQPKRFSIPGFFQVTRIQNLSVIILTQYLAAIFLVNNYGSTNRLLEIDLFILVISTVLIAAAGYLINDYYDVKIDLINKPDKVVVGTVLKRRSVMMAHTVFNFMGVTLGLIIDYRIGIRNFAAAFILWLYSNQLKRTLFLGNLVVAALAGLTVMVVGIFHNQVNMAIILYSAFAFTSNLVREIVKDIEDLQGDVKFGSKTLPIVLGIRKTKGVILFINISFFIFILNLLSGSAFPGPDLVLYFILVPLILLSGMLIRADKKKDFSILSSSIKWFMLIGIATMILIDYPG